ncbi:MAG TPA: hypothetical protein VKX28_26830 [Xanthobacteraceae bacterium]|nr:hypothetical protein [Xanthobacteraceae bacterium]
MADTVTPTPPSQDQINDVLARYGVGPGPSTVVAPASSDDAAQVLQRYGVTLNPKAPVAPTADSDAAARGLVVPGTNDDLAKVKPGSKFKFEAGEYFTPQEVKSGLNRGIGSQFVNGIPIVGPAFNALTAEINPGAPTFGQRFYDQQAADRAYAALHPALSTGANVAGSLVGYGGIARAAPALLGLSGPTTGARIYQGIAGGGGLNALDAILRGENPIPAATIGAVSGGIAPAAGAVSEGAANAAARLAWPRPNALAGVPRSGINVLTNALAGETPSSIAAAVDRMGPAGVFADLNPRTTDIAGAISDLPIAERTAIQNAYRARAAAAPQRVDAALTKATGVPGGINVVQYADWLDQQRSAAAGPLYDQFRSMSVQPTPKLTQDIIPRLEKAGAFERAEYLAGITGQKIDRANMTPAQYDLVKQGLDSKIDQAYANGDKTVGSKLVALKNDLIDEIGQTNAGQVWNKARQTFADRSNVIDQLEAGYNTPLGGRSAQSVDEFEQEWNGLSRPEQIARTMGWRKMIAETMGEPGNAASITRGKLLSPNNQAKMRIMFGDQKADELIGTLQQEKDFADRLPAVIPNWNTGASAQTRAERMQMFAPPTNALSSWTPGLDLTNPLHVVPSALRPGTVAQDFAMARAGRVPPSLVPILLTPQAQVPDVADAIMSEGNRLAKTSSLVRNYVARPAQFAIAGPGQAEYRRRYELAQPLQPPTGP